MKLTSLVHMKHIVAYLTEHERKSEVFHDWKMYFELYLQLTGPCSCLACIIVYTKKLINTLIVEIPWLIPDELIKTVHQQSLTNCVLVHFGYSISSEHR